ncbi:LacI family DNA-binding transcriptional regulator [Pontivivens insulae]|uniref:Maltose regulon regulatory protein MalI n=1 Tax=Pontivivens insulae TaxID=1639689 RepID=A0A2R8A7I8_9RHOB|nr:LacI family DNA-binding transcriptional regulator [Pontivivens insulae]RED18093.1 LacI family transcriptional regulator [Pontivivens insulae]SPF27990.1 Maltose regulon regulatory protein MalI [Pontivivens insulae]
MTKRPTLETVATRAGVSLATASQVMRGKGRISDETRKRVQAAARELHYVRDGRAAAMRSGANLEIGFVINKISNPFNAEVVSGVSDRLGKEGYLVSILDGGDDAALHATHLQSFIENGRAGLLWVPATDTAATTIEMLRTNLTPTVTFMRDLEGSPFDHVGIRNAAATTEATEHLIALGHRRIAYLGGQNQSSVRRERVAGYVATMARHDLGEPIIWECVDTKPASFEAVMALYKAYPDVTAMVCNGDMVALGASVGLDRLGLTVGHDVSIVGFDGIADAALSIPSLTTMSISPYELGRKLASTLLDRMQNPESPSARAELAAKLIVRNSSGPAPKL